jgi:hypothetical protein
MEHKDSLVFTRVCHWTLTKTIKIQSTPYTHYFLKLHLHLILPSDLFLSVFQTKILYVLPIYAQPTQMNMLNN